MKQTYYLNFCRSHQHKHSYIKIVANSYDDAFRVACAKFSLGWQKITEQDKFDKTKYPKGQLMLIEVN